MGRFPAKHTAFENKEVNMKKHLYLAIWHFESGAVKSSLLTAAFFIANLKRSFV